MHSAGGWDHPVLHHLKWGLLFTCAVYRENNLYLTGILFREQLCVVCYGFSLKWSRVRLCCLFCYHSFFFIITYPYLYFYETSFGLFFAPTRHTSVMSICASSFNEIKKKPRMRPRTSGFVPCFVLFFSDCLQQNPTVITLSRQSNQALPTFSMNYH